jgi:hypothetical protein
MRKSTSTSNRATATAAAATKATRASAVDAKGTRTRVSVRGIAKVVAPSSRLKAITAKRSTVKAVKVTARAASLKASGGYTEQQLSLAYNNVKAAKGSNIRCTIANPGKKNLDCLAHAVVYYTGHFATITKLDNSKIKVAAKLV